MANAIEQVGSPDYNSLNPDSSIQGFNSANSLLQTYANRVSGQDMSQGNLTGAANEQFQQGNLQGGAAIQDRQAALTAQSTAQGLEQQKQSLQFIKDTADSLEQVRQAMGDDHVLAAFDQMTPLFKAREGATPDTIAQIRSSLEADPETFIRTMSSAAQMHLEKLGAGDQMSLIDPGTSSSKVVASAPAYHDLAPGASLVRTGGSTGGGVAAPGGAGSAPVAGFAGTAPPQGAPQGNFPAPGQGLPATTPISFQPPVQGPVTSGFGPRPRPMAGATTNHMGIDFGVPVGTPVSAAADGQVLFAGQKGGYGNAVTIRHADGSTTLYGHLSSINVQPGQQVHQGDVIAKSGATGTATGPNLHFGHYSPTGQAMDPSHFGTSHSAPAAGLAAPQGATSLSPDAQVVATNSPAGGGDGKPFTLTPDASRYDAQGHLIVRAPPKPPTTGPGTGKLPPQDAARIRAMDAWVDNAQNLADFSKQWMQRASGVNTGPQWNQFGGHSGTQGANVGGVRPAAVYDYLFNPNEYSRIQELDALTNRVTPMLRPAGSGRILGQEYTNFGRAFPSSKNPMTANQGIDQEIQQQAQSAATKVQFFRDWGAKNGSLNGADDAWTSRVHGAIASAPPPGATNRTWDPVRGLH